MVEHFLGRLSSTITDVYKSVLELSSTLYVLFAICFISHVMF